MAQGGNLTYTDTVTATEDIARQLFVTVAGAKAVSPATAYGILLFPAVNAKEATVVVAGVVVGTSGAAITKGSPVMCDANGKVITATAGNEVFGIALTATSGANEDVKILIDRFKI